MDFLRSLAPNQGNARQRAVAAVRSRFEAARPIQSMPPTTSDGDGDEGNSAAETPLVRDATLGVSATRIIAPNTTTPLGAARDTRAPVDPTDHRTQTGRPRMEVHSTVDIPEQTREVAMDVLRAPVRHVMSQRLEPVAGRVQLSTPELERRSRLTNIHVVPALASVVRTTHVPADERPLSRQAVLSRIEQPGERRPIVHVTIDRIDVRAPAAPERAASRSRTRSSSSNGSLAEYLRARQPGRSGGVK